ncbi:MAG: hypothetical protein KC442_14175, partial [Thermomicrobiales bacterium]|nr:hypothetical protein [Thermomicrobiales bacterium]
MIAKATKLIQPTDRLLSSIPSRTGSRSLMARVYWVGSPAARRASDAAQSVLDRADGTGVAGDGA